MNQIVSVQVLRALAALTVAFGHAQHDAKVQALKLGAGFERVHLLPWGAGVDLFFVISGFIMVHASERLFGRADAPARFLARRLARIVPLYWLFTALYLLVLVRAHMAEGRSLPDLADVAASFAFWPTDAFGDGVPRPVYTLGWTLNYEMFFYALFALFVGLPRGRAVACVAAALGGLVVLGAALPLEAAAPFFWTRPIVLEFALGMGLALLHRRGILLPLAVRLALLTAGTALLVLDPMASGAQAMDWITPNDLLRVLGWGVPAAAIMAACVLAPRGRPSAIGRVGSALGDASYALYLVHPFAILGLRRAWLAAGLHESLGLWPMVAVSLLLSCAAALVVHRLVERPLTHLVQGRIAGRSPAAAPV